MWYALACLLCCLSCGYALAYLLCCLSCAHWRWFLSPGTFLSCATLPSFLSPEASLGRSAPSPRRLELGSFEMVLKVVSEALPRNFQNAAREGNAASKGTETNVLRRPSFVARSSFVVRRSSFVVVPPSSFVVVRRSKSKLAPESLQNCTNSKATEEKHIIPSTRSKFIQISSTLAAGWLQNDSKMIPKWSKNDSKMAPRRPPGGGSHLGGTLGGEFSQNMASRVHGSIVFKTWLSLNGKRGSCGTR